MSSYQFHHKILSEHSDNTLKNSFISPLFTSLTAVSVQFTKDKRETIGQLEFSYYRCDVRKKNAFDVVMTVSIGSVLVTIITSNGFISQNHWVLT